MRQALLILLWLCAPAVWSQTAGAPAAAWQLVDRCIDDADPATEGIEQLELECPGLRAALDDSGYAAFLSADQFGQLTAHGLVELRHLSERYAPNAKSGGRLERSTLDAILASLEAQSEAKQLSLWERLERWLRGLLERQQERDLSWLAEWLEKLDIPEFGLKMALYILVGLVIVIAIGVVINEMRVAGIWRRRRNTARAGGDLSNGLPQQGLSLADLARLPVRDRLSSLLRILVQALVASGRLRAERGLTHRELSRNTQFADSRQREAFERIAAAAERLVYGRGDAVLDEIELLIHDGRQLHAQLVEQRA